MSIIILHRLMVLLFYSLFLRGSMQNRHEELGINFIMKDIPWYEGLYAITEQGRVWSYPKNKWHHKWKFLAPIKNKYWYLVFWLCRNNKLKIYRVNRLVALTYIPNPDNLPIVLHLDNNKLNNDISNLRWWTNEDNLRQSHRDWLHPVTDKQKSLLKMFCNCMIEDNKKKIMRLDKTWLSKTIYKSWTEASIINWISRSSICKCARWELKSAGGFIWKYI